MTVDGVSKRAPEQGRIVITLECTMPRKYWPLYSETVTVTDAVDCLRQNVVDYENGELTLEDLIDMADNVTVVATK